VDVGDDFVHGRLEFVDLVEECKGVEGVDEGEAVVAEDFVDVASGAVGGAVAALAADWHELDWHELVGRVGVLHVVGEGVVEHFDYFVPEKTEVVSFC